MDYNPIATPSNGTLSNMLTSLRVCATISVVEDEELETDEQFSVFLLPASPDNCATFSPNQTTVTILDDSELIMLTEYISMYLHVYACSYVPALSPSYFILAPLPGQIPTILLCFTIILIRFSVAITAHYKLLYGSAISCISIGDSHPIVCIIPYYNQM